MKFSNIIFIKMLSIISNDLSFGFTASPFRYGTGDMTILYPGIYNRLPGGALRCAGFRRQLRSQPALYFFIRITNGSGFSALTDSPTFILQGQHENRGEGEITLRSIPQVS